MSFVSTEFAVFFAVVFAAYAVLPHRLQNLLLLVASAVFYGWEHPGWVGLLYFSAGIDHLAARGMERFPERRRALLALSLTANLALLGWFKYAGFFADNLRDLGAPVPLVDVVLPAGISFYTFQSMAYTVDVYRGRIPACRRLLDYYVFVSFFPQLVAGPIERASDLLTQVQNTRRVTKAGMAEGVVRVAKGVWMKCVVADNVALYVDRVYGLPHHGALLALAGAFAFSVQILADFGGYTEIARGLACALGFRLSPNFLSPYLAADPGEFWRRWHVTFSSWIRDYLYIPLGGSRGTAARVVAVTVLTMSLSGLWHGAAWNFVLWGAYHGVLVVLYRAFAGPIARVPRAVRVVLFFGLTVVGWGLFRQHDLGVLLDTLRHPWPAEAGAERVVAAVIGTVGAVGGLALAVTGLVERHVVPRLGRWQPAFGAAFVSLVATSLLFWGRTTADAFIYFRF